MDKNLLARIGLENVGRGGGKPAGGRPPGSEEEHPIVAAGPDVLLGPDAGLDLPDVGLAKVEPAKTRLPEAVRTRHPLQAA